MPTGGFRGPVPPLPDPPLRLPPDQHEQRGASKARPIRLRMG